MAILTPPKVTDVGRAAAMSQSALGLSLSLTHVLVGSASYSPVETQTALVAPLHKGTLVGTATVGDVVSGAMRVTRATYTGALADIGEIGLYAGDPDAGGILFAVLSNPPDTYGQIGGTHVTDLTASISMRLASLPAGSVTIVADPTFSSAAALLMDHIASTTPHPWASWLPVGVVLPFYGVNPPRGFVSPYGWLLQRTLYPELWAHAQAQGLVVTEAEWTAGKWGFFSDGDGSTTFRLPDMRGEFMRIHDAGRGVDLGRIVGSFQDWATGRPKNTTPKGVNESGASQTLRTAGQALLTGASALLSQLGFARVARTGNRNTATAVDTTGSGYELDIVNVTEGDAETRPRNIALGAIMVAAGSPSNTPTTAPSPGGSTSPAQPPAPVPSPAPAPSAPAVVEFRASPLVTDMGQGYNGGARVYFTDLTDHPSIASWAWQFGDGGTSNQQHPVHVYPFVDSVGVTYDVTLTVITTAGGTYSLTKTAYITTNGYPPGA